eukprot:1139865-Pelagomonas_calceolata.AAC.9
MGGFCLRTKGMLGKLSGLPHRRDICEASYAKLGCTATNHNHSATQPQGAAAPLKLPAGSSTSRLQEAVPKGNSASCLKEAVPIGSSASSLWKAVPVGAVDLPAGSSASGPHLPLYAKRA